MEQSLYSDGLPSFINKGLLWLKHVVKFLTKFKNGMKVQIHDGHSTTFWYDNWGSYLEAPTYLELFYFTVNKSISVRSTKNLEHLSDHFHMPLYVEAYL